MAADDAQLGLAVAHLGVPLVHDLGRLGQDLALLLFRRGVDEEAVLGQAHLVAGLLEEVAHVGVEVAPEHALGAHDAVGPVVLDKVLEGGLVKGLATVVDKGLDVVLQHLWVVVLLGVLHGLDPGGGVIGLHEVKAAGVQDLPEVDFALGGLDDDGVLLKAAHDGLELGELFGRHGVGLVEHERGAELDLGDEQRLDVVLVDVVGQKVAAAVELVVHAGAVHHGHDVVQRELGGAADLLLVAEGRDGVGDGHGLADAGGLDDDVVEVAGVCQAGELVSQVVGKGAADAAVGERDKVVGGRKAAILDEAGVDVDLADVVDDDGRADAAVVGQNVVEQRGLAGTEVAGEHHDLDGVVGHGVSFAGVG